jgi:hypothetical protein
MSQISAATHADEERSVVRTLESRIEQLRTENSQLRGEVSVLEAGAALISQHQDQRLIDASRFRAILANNRSGIILVAPNGIVVEVVHSIFGYGKSELVARNCEDFMQLLD